jgi:hypothetical protein
MSPALFLRQAGYSIARSQQASEESFIRRLGGSEYPHFHVYYQETNDEIIFNLHLDQKRPSYPGAPAHSGEYDGDLVAEEIARLRSLIS